MSDRQHEWVQYLLGFVKDPGGRLQLTLAYRGGEPPPRCQATAGKKVRCVRQEGHEGRHMAPEIAATVTW